MKSWVQSLAVLFEMVVCVASTFQPTNQPANQAVVLGPDLLSVMMMMNEDNERTNERIETKIRNSYLPLQSSVLWLPLARRRHHRHRSPLAYELKSAIEFASLILSHQFGSLINHWEKIPICWFNNNLG